MEKTIKQEIERMEYFVIGGQYEHLYYGSSMSLHGAKIMATQNMEYWDNWQGWNKPKIYDKNNVVKIITKGRVLYPDGREIYVPIQNATFLYWDDVKQKWKQGKYGIL